MIRFQFVEDHKTEYSVKRMRTVLKLTRSSFYTWKATQARHTSRIYADGVLRARITAVFAEEDELYGAQRITASRLRPLVWCICNPL
ncbi:hypothetical protein I4J35_02010 [Corynebacterium belfantii]|nr:hypothetical protein [Corynebacterium belfantii]MBG9327660.1 hypothetical protein [Corynebacterium belfantii]